MVNPLKQALRDGSPQIGLWQGLACAYSAELCADAGFDWLLFDGEHAPNDIPTLLNQLQAVRGSSVHPIARPPICEAWIIKQYLDIGFTSLLLPLVRNAAHAAELVRMTRYPPEGVRGVGAAIARASRWNRDQDYLARANDDLCVIVQVETPEALDEVSAIASTPGVDCVFFGPADLAASLGHRGNPGHPDVTQVIEAGIAAVIRAGNIPGILTSDVAVSQHYLELGCRFVGVGNDVGLLVRALDVLAGQFGRQRAIEGSGSGPY